MHPLLPWKLVAAWGQLRFNFHTARAPRALRVQRAPICMRVLAKYRRITASPLALPCNNLQARVSHLHNLGACDQGKGGVQLQQHQHFVEPREDKRVQPAT